ncbi:MAG: tetratricopeptide repeat protein [Syntrophales bacterium]
MKRMMTYCLLFIAVLFLPAEIANGANQGIYYSIHNGSYRTEESAREYAGSIEKMGIPAFVEKMEMSRKKTLYRVYVGKYEDMKKAKGAIAALRKKSIKGLGPIRRFSLIEPAELAPPDAKANQGKALPVAGNTSLKTKAEGLKSPEAKKEKDKAAPNDRALADADSRRAEPAADPVIDKAGRAFREGCFPEAIELLKGFTSPAHSDKRSAEAALRLIAESWYRIGEKGDSQALLKAVDHYKMAFTRYPDPAAGNDIAYYNMAKSYEKLNFLYEAAAAWEGIALNYPDSPFAEEAFFRSGYVLLSTGKKEKTIEKLSRYTTKYPNGVFGKKAYYTIGETLFRLRSFDQAVKWFDSAKNKWPDWSDVPMHVLDSMGKSYFIMARYAEAFQVSSFLANIYPNDDLGRNAFFLMAQSADKSGYVNLAVRLYGLFIEKYPQSKEAGECELALAKLGLEHPGLKLMANIWKTDSYSKPLQTYDRMLAKGGGDLEPVMFWRGKALEKNGDFRGALDNYIEMLSKYPRGKLTEAVLERIKDTAAALVELSYVNSDYPAVADIYFKLRGKVSLSGDFGTRYKIGRSLQQIGIYREAREIYNELKDVRKDVNDEDLEIALAEVDIAMKDSVAAEYKLLHLSGKGRKNNNKIFQNAQRKLADLYMESGNFERAAAFYAKVISQGGQRDALLYLNYGRCLEAKKLTDGALESFLAALEYCEGNRESCENSILSEIYAGLGDLSRRQNNFDKGVAMYRKALEYASDKESKRWLMLKIGKSYAGMDDFRAAERNFSLIKEGQDSDFWPGIADFFISQSVRAQESRGKQ